MKDKKSIAFLSVSLVIIFLIAIFSFLYEPTDNIKKNISNDDNAVLARATIESNSVIKEEKKDFIKITVDEYLDIYNSNNPAIVLIGRMGCAYCQIAEPIIQNIMYRHGIDIYYISTDDFTAETEEKFMNSNEQLNSFATPLLLIVQSGKINDKQEGLIGTDGYEKFLKKNNFIN